MPFPAEPHTPVTATRPPLKAVLVSALFSILFPPTCRKTRHQVDASLYPQIMKRYSCSGSHPGTLSVNKTQ